MESVDVQKSSTSGSWIWPYQGRSGTVAGAARRALLLLMGTLPLWGALLGLVLAAVVVCPGHLANDAIVLQGALTICEIPCGCALM